MHVTAILNVAGRHYCYARRDAPLIVRKAVFQSRGVAAPNLRLNSIVDSHEAPIRIRVTQSPLGIASQG